ncbi:MAG: class I SAM-dependent methyltransferase [Kofleriaceae bacterium]|nr:class I SAM-dependent methyltransferase [Myxococcales bacterium]MCB9564572.1 class I SAM-dependent methyltransferase [Kofleriaceae bacterium]
MSKTLSHSQARRVYDLIGPLLDTQAWYEDGAIADLLAHLELGDARAVVELGTGTGRLAERMLDGLLPREATYLGYDVSRRMVATARKRLHRWVPRAEVRLSNGPIHVDLPDRSADLFVSTYVFDLLSADDIATALAEAHRVLRDDGRLALISLAPGRSLPERAVMGLWSRVQSVWPSLIAGCRPIELQAQLEPARWRVDHAATVGKLGVVSEVVIATPRRDGGGAA